MKKNEQNSFIKFEEKNMKLASALRNNLQRRKVLKNKQRKNQDQ